MRHKIKKKKSVYTFTYIHVSKVKCLKKKKGTVD